MNAPLSTFVALLWASTRLWPPSAILPLLAARTHVLLAELPHPKREHLDVVPDHHTLRTLFGVARPELAGHPGLAAACEQLVSACEQAHWFGPSRGALGAA